MGIEILKTSAYQMKSVAHHGFLIPVGGYNVGISMNCMQIIHI